MFRPLPHLRHPEKTDGQAWNRKSSQCSSKVALRHLGCCCRHLYGNRDVGLTPLIFRCKLARQQNIWSGTQIATKILHRETASRQNMNVATWCTCCCWSSWPFYSCWCVTTVLLFVVHYTSARGPFSLSQLRHFLENSSMVFKTSFIPSVLQF